MKGIRGRLVAGLVLTFVGALFVFWAALAGAAAIPNSAIRENMTRSALSYRDVDAFALGDDILNRTADNYADAILLNISYNMGKADPVTGSLNTGYYAEEETGVNYGLYLSVAEDKVPNNDYTRYWHGSSIFVRLCHLFTDVNGMKLLGFGVICLLILLTLGMLLAKKQIFPTIALVLSLCAVQFWNLRLSLEYQSAYLLAFALCPLYLLAEKKGDTKLLFLSVIGGTAVAFFDFLTTETVTILLPLLLIFSIRAKEHRLGSLKESFFLTGKCLIAWGVAYAMTFLAKWILAALITDAGVFETALSSVAERLGGSVGDYQDKPAHIFSSLLANLTMPFGSDVRVASGLALGGIGVILLILFSIWYLFRSKTPNRSAWLFLTLGGLVLLRFLVLNNHSFLHCFFTYRALCPTVFALLMALWLNLQTPTKPRKKVGK